jgi:putative ABC transport system permease protein
VTLLLLVSSTLTERLTRDARGIDLVVGAKGSSLQIVLSTVFQVDIPTGNIPLEEAYAIIHNPRLDFGVPMALGDAVASFRIPDGPALEARGQLRRRTWREWQRRCAHALPLHRHRHSRTKR